MVDGRWFATIIAGGWLKIDEMIRRYFEHAEIALYGSVHHRISDPDSTVP